ncbi:MAG: hypothetical protein FVQ81_02280 [Candidatus Glassbacteria bacterium]|nr:hypothetical protein [Candidatus Glassbacteria bacterium]
MSLTAVVLLSAVSALSSPLGYFSQSVPDGISAGRTFPAGSLSRLGEAILTSDNAVYTLAQQQSRINLTLLESFQQPVRFFPADINGDKYQDLIVAFTETPALRLLIGHADGETVRTDLVISSQAVLAVGAARIDADTLPDLVIADSTRIVILRRVPPDSGNGIEFRQFSELSLHYPASGHPLASMTLLFGDFDGNKRTDFVLNGYLYLNQRDNLIIARELPVPTGTKIKLLDLSADLDGDRKHELLWISAPSASLPCKLTIADYDANLIFRAGGSVQTGLSAVTRAFLYDADADGHLELGLFSSADGSAVELAGTVNGLDLTAARNLFTLNSVKGSFIGPLGPEDNGETTWLFHNTASDLLYTGYALRPYADATDAAGLVDTLAGLAAAVGDYNYDGLPDIYVINNRGNNALYQGQPDGTFTEVAVQAGVAQTNDGISCAWGDFNNDGFQDLVVAGLSLPDKLFFNLGDGTFADSSQLLRYSRGNQRATSVSWGDVNSDGWLDLLVTNYDEANWLLINHLGRYFDNTGPGLGPTDTYYRTENASLVDVNLDGRQDIVLLNDGGPTRLLLGSSGGQWTDLTAASGLNPEAEYLGFGQSQSWGDFNGDGYPDLYITRATDIDMMFLNNGADAVQQFRLVYSGNPGGGRFGRLASVIEDLDTDGRTDLLITRSSQFGSNYEIPGNQVYLGDSMGYPPIAADEMSSSTVPAGDALVAPLRFRRETSLPLAGDFDGDGDIDLLFVNYLPDNPSDLFRGSQLPLIFMRNGSARANTLTIILRRADNRNLAGTSVSLSYGGRTYWKSVSGGGGRIQTGPYLTFSLGTASQADSMTVRWADGVEQTLYGPFYPGTFELEVDHTAPRLELLEWPGGGSQGELVLSSTVPLSGTLGADDNSGFSRLLLIVRLPATGSEDTTNLVTGISAGRVDFSIATPLPGDSLDFYFSATDTYGNSTRLPSSPGAYYRLVAKTGVLLGDLNGDLKVDFSNDGSRLLEIIGGKGLPPTELELLAADLNFDGKVDIYDLLSLLKLL